MCAVLVSLQAAQATNVLQAKAKEAQQQLQLAGKSLGKLGQKLVVGTSDLFDQIKDAIQNEMAFDEPQGPQRRIPSKRQLATSAGAKYSRCARLGAGPHAHGPLPALACTQ